MVYPHQTMLGDSGVYLCMSEDHTHCGAHVSPHLWPAHAEFHLRLDGVATAVFGEEEEE